MGIMYFGVLFLYFTTVFTPAIFLFHKSFFKPAFSKTVLFYSIFSFIFSYGIYYTWALYALTQSASGTDLREFMLVIFGLGMYAGIFSLIFLIMLFLFLNRAPTILCRSVAAGFSAASISWFLYVLTQQRTFF